MIAKSRLIFVWNNNYDLKYPSYKQDSNSHRYDDKYKSKDRDSSVRISKIECENVNNNFNNVGIGNLSIGNSGSRGVVSDDGINGASTENAFGNNGEKHYDDIRKIKT
jgi:hypothetical protein